MVYGLWFMVHGLCFVVYGSWLRFQGEGLWFRVYGLWFRVYGLASRVSHHGPQLGHGRIAGLDDDVEHRPRRVEELAQQRVVRLFCG